MSFTIIQGGQSLSESETIVASATLDSILSSKPTLSYRQDPLLMLLILQVMRKCETEIGERLEFFCDDIQTFLLGTPGKHRYSTAEILLANQALEYRRLICEESDMLTESIFTLRRCGRNVVNILHERSRKEMYLVQYLLYAHYGRFSIHRTTQPQGYLKLV